MFFFAAAIHRRMSACSSWDAFTIFPLDIELSKVTSQQQQQKVDFSSLDQDKSTSTAKCTTTRVLSSSGCSFCRWRKNESRHHRYSGSLGLSDRSMSHGDRFSTCLTSLRKTPIFWQCLHPASVVLIGYWLRVHFNRKSRILKIGNTGNVKWTQSSVANPTDCDAQYPQQLWMRCYAACVTVECQNNNVFWQLLINSHSEKKVWSARRGNFR